MSRRIRNAIRRQNYWNALYRGRRSAAASSGGGGVSDPSFDNVVLLLPFTTAAGLTDASASGLDAVAAGNAAVGTTVLDPFGNDAGVLELDGTGDHVVITPAGTELDIGPNEDFTIEWWGIMQGSPCWWGVDNGWYAYNNNFRFGNIFYAMETSPQDTDWHHFAVSRTSGVIETYFDGTRGSSTASTRQDIVPSALDIGHYPPNNNLNVNGYISNFRFTKGVGRYTGASIDVPTEAFPLS